MNHNHSTNNSKHMLMMLACCLIPIGLVLAVGLFGITLGSLTPFLPFAIVLLCPLMMFFMMRGMGHDHGEGDTHHMETVPAALGSCRRFPTARKSNLTLGPTRRQTVRSPRAHPTMYPDIDLKRGLR